MKRRIDNRRDILLLLLYSPGRTEQPNEPIAGRTRLIKMLFLFREELLKDFRGGVEINSDNFYQFFPWDFGPFSREVYDDLTFFELRGFIERQDSDEDALPESAAEWELWLAMSRADTGDDPISEYDEQVFRLTTWGERFTSQLYATLTVNQKHLLRMFKARLLKVPLRALLKYVYENYETQTTKSKIKEQVLGREFTV